MLALCCGRFSNYWLIKDILNRLLNTPFILRCVVHFECTEVEIWFSSVHISFNVASIKFYLSGGHNVRVLVLIWRNIAVLESCTWDVITLLRDIGLAELGDELHTLGFVIRIVPNAVIREIVSSRCLSLPGISIAHVNITLKSFALICLHKRTNIPFLLRHNFVKRSVGVNRFWIVTHICIAQLKVRSPNVLRPCCSCLFGHILTYFFDWLIRVLRSIWVPGPSSL